MRASEEEIVSEILRQASRAPQPGVSVGIGDDAAVVTPPPRGERLLLSTDQVIEGTHFIPDLHPPRALGHKCLARGLSDIAAMGGAPCYVLLSLCLPAWVDPAWLRAYLAGLLRLSRRFRAPLVGGDVAGGGQFGADVTVVGAVGGHRLLRRSGAKPGHGIFVSGRLGGSALGLERLSTRAFPVSDPAIRRHLYPQPRLELGRFLRNTLGASAAMDLSDGLSTDLERLAKAGGVGAEIEESAVPRFRGAAPDQALHGGEDYELLFTVPTKKVVPPSFRRIRLTQIGRIRSEPGIVLLSKDGPRVLQPEGFAHFTKASFRSSIF